MPLTEDQIREYYRRGLAAGIPQDDLIAEVQRRMGGVPSVPDDPIARLTSQFEGTQAIPTESVASTPDVGWFTGLNDLIPATIKEGFGGPLAGVGETIGLVEEGTRQGIREEFEDERLRYIAGGPGTNRRAAASGILELGANLIPIAPGKYLGAKAAAKVGGSKLKKLVGAGVAAASEGAVVAVGETVGLPLEERIKKGALLLAASTGLGALGGIKAVAGPKLGAKDPVVKDFLGKYKGEDVGKRSPEWFQKIRQQWEDSLHPIVRAGQKAAAKAGDPDILTVTEIRAQAARTAESTSMEPIQGKTRTIEGRETGEGLDDIFADLDVDTYHEVEAYSMARHNIELAERAKMARDEVVYYKELLGELDPKVDKELASQTKEALKIAEANAKIHVEFKGLQDSERLLDHLKDKYGVAQDGEAMVLGERAKRLTEFADRSVIEPLVEVGVFSKAQADAIRAKGEWYVPFIRAIDELDKMERLGMVEPGLGSAPVRGKRIGRGLESRKGLRIKDVYQELGERAIRVHAFVRKQALRNHLADVADRYADDIGLEVAPSRQGVHGSTFRVFRDGELLHYAADKDLLGAVESLNVTEVNWVLKSARWLTRLFRAGATLTPQFGFGNVTRDQFTFGTYSKEGGIPFFGPARAIMDEWSHMYRNGGISSQEWDAFMRSSGGHASFVEGDRFNVERHVAVVKRRGRRGGSGRLARLWRKNRANPIAHLQSMSAMLERPARFAEFRKRYKRALANGATPERAEQLAGLAASDVTLNFPRGGTIGKRWNLYEAFFNAMMQDVSKFSRAMSERPFKTSAKALAYITAPSMAAWAKFHNDEDYKNLAEWDKALFIHLHKFDSGRFFRVPMPPGILGLIFSYLPRKAADAFFTGDPGVMKDVLREATNQTPLQYLPIPGVNSAKDIVIESAPNAIQPIMEIVANRQPFFDRPVISKRYEGLPAAEQKHWRTSNLAKGIAGVGNALGGEFSPIEVDHLIAGYGAGLGRQVAGLSGSSAGAAQQMGEEGIFRLPGFDRFLSSSPYGFGSQPVRDFYELLDAAEKSEKGLNIQSTDKTRDGYLRLHPEAAYGKDLRRIKKQLTEYAQWRDSVREDKDLEAWEKEDMLLKIDQETTRFASEIMASIHDAIRLDQSIMEQEGEQ